MQKILKILVLALLLSGCRVNNVDIKVDITVALDAASNADLIMNQSLHKANYVYYLPPDVGRKESSQSSTILVIQNTNVLMNLDIVSVLSDRFYKSDKIELLRAFIAASTPIYKKEDATFDLDHKSLPYAATIVTVEGNSVLISLQTRYFLFSAIAPFALASDLLYDMLLIARTCRVNADQVVLRYSNRETINYQKETLDIFSQLAPESGKVIDMISVNAGQDGVEE
ncbi:MAG: hypothetical protein WBL80_06685 [Erysipelotrichaceae bacterium]